eukprot:TRINITY_DN24427_c0_g1_i1.p1 TRINITY_DN24427_c0_g1~~TRINITY_DN24427_c0_g1_i1.p1  ORF type:complete len:360 (+),score=97.86 TRINITY_DN24427_c0_g1_i1:57-1082(+)
MMDSMTLQQQMVRFQAAGLPPQTLPFQQNVWVCLPQQEAVGMQRLMMAPQMGQGQFIQQMQVQQNTLNAQDVAAQLNAGIFAVSESMGGQGLQARSPPPQLSQVILTNNGVSNQGNVSPLMMTHGGSNAPSPTKLDKEREVKEKKANKGSVRIEVPPSSPKNASGTLPPLDDSSEEAQETEQKPKKKSRKSRRRKLDVARFKTVMCRNFLKSGCAFGDACAFAHSEQDLREWNEEDSASASPNLSAASTPTAAIKSDPTSPTATTPVTKKPNSAKAKQPRKASIIEDPSVQAHRTALDWRRRASAIPLSEEKAITAAYLRRASAPAALQQRMELLEIDDEE